MTIKDSYKYLTWYSQTVILNKNCPNFSLITFDFLRKFFPFREEAGFSRQSRQELMGKQELVQYWQCGKSPIISLPLNGVGTLHAVSIYAFWYRLWMPQRGSQAGPCFSQSSVSTSHLAIEILGWCVGAVVCRLSVVSAHLSTGLRPSTGSTLHSEPCP